MTGVGAFLCPSFSCVFFPFSSFGSKIAHLSPPPLSIFGPPFDRSAFLGSWSAGLVCSELAKTNNSSVLLGILDLQGDLAGI